MSLNSYTSEAEQILKEGDLGDVQVYDPRELKNGKMLPLTGYLDQPYLVKADDGAWVLCVTKGHKHEGLKGQTIYTMRSLDKGNTWQDITPIEPVDGPEASYAVMVKVPSGRIYIFYNHNTDNIRSIETANSGTYYRVDSLGHFVFKYSDDCGISWSKTRYEIPQRMFEIDKNNYHKGELKYFWNVGKPFILDNKCYVSLHKIGEFGHPGGFVSSEGVLLCSDNILIEKDPLKINWETLPKGIIGIKAPENGGKVAEEQSYVTLSDGSIFVVFRTVSGHSAFAYSRDKGNSFTKAQFMRYPDGRLIKHPRAANFVWKLKNGKYLYWFHNNGSKGYDNRNPVWVLGGTEKDSIDGKIIEWSQPEILFYDDDPILLISYPDLIEEDDGIYISETQKQIARIHHFDKTFFASVLKEKIELPKPIFTTEDCGKIPFIKTESFYRRNTNGTAGGWVSQKRGYTFVIEYENLSDEEVLFSTLDSMKCGLELTFKNNNFSLYMFDGRTKHIFDTDECFIKKEKGKICIVIDGGPNIVYFVYDSKFLDGGSQRIFGWLRMSKYIYGINGSDEISINEKVKKFVLYDKALGANSI